MTSKIVQMHWYFSILFENNVSITTNGRKLLVYERKVFIKAIQQSNGHVILIRNYGDISKLM